MRKHFLLLFLMAILPLAGFAGDFSTATVTITNPTYGSTTLDITASLLPTGGASYDYETLFYYDEACTNLVKDANQTAIPLQKLPVNEGSSTWYWVKVSANGHTGFKAGQFQVRKAHLTIQYDMTSGSTPVAKPLEVNYKAVPDFTLTTSKITVTGWANDDGATVITGTTTWEDAVKAALKCEYTDATSVKNANWTVASGVTGGAWISSTEKGYDLTFSFNNLNAAVDLSNYEITWPTNEMKVYPIMFVAAAANGFSYAVKSGTYTPTVPATSTAPAQYFFTYDGTAHMPEYVVKYKNETLTFAESSTATTGDFYVTYEWSADNAATPATAYAPEGDSHAVKNAWAGYYKATINARANGNYYGTIPFPDFRTNTTTGSAIPYYEIGKKATNFMAIDRTKVYDGTAWDLTNDFRFRVSPLATADAQTSITGVAGAIVSGTFDKNVGSWEVYPVVTASSLPPVISNNYSYTVENFGHSTMSITRRPVTVTAKAQTNTLGDATMFDPTALNLVYETQATDQQLYTTYVTIQDQGTNVGVAVESTDTNFGTEIADILSGFTLKFATDVDQTINNVWAEGIEVNVKSTTGTSPAYSGNYAISGVAGQYTILGKTITLFADATNLIYGDNVNEGLQYATSGLTGGAQYAPTSVTYTITKADGTTPVTPDANGVLPYDASNYLFKIASIEKGTLPAGYDDVIVDTNPAVLTIAKKIVYAIAEPATLSKGNTVDDLNTVGRSSVTFRETNHQTAGVYDGPLGLVGNDKISYMLKFESGVTVDATTKKINAIANNATIKVYEVLPTGSPAAVPEGEEDYYEADNANANYTIIPVAAALTNGAGILVLNRTDAGLLNQLTAANNLTYTVRLAGYTNAQKLQAGKWYSMVLPFQISVAKLSAAMKPASTTAEPNPAGYAIVNLVDETTTEPNNVHFKLEMSSIPENTPFLVKTATDVDLNFKDANSNGTAENGDNFVQFENVKISAPADNIVKDVNGVNFTSVYKHGNLPTGASLYSGKYYTMPDDSYTIDAFASYWLAAPGARVFVEDLENGTTVIREISTESMEAVAADGWYTINGIKLQGVPTEKGIYINNGKKIVIK